MWGQTAAAVDRRLSPFADPSCSPTCTPQVFCVLRLGFGRLGSSGFKMRGQRKTFQVFPRLKPTWGPAYAARLPAQRAMRAPATTAVGRLASWPGTLKPETDPPSASTLKPTDSPRPYTLLPWQGPDFPTAAQRPMYSALNMYRASGGNPQCGASPSAMRHTECGGT